MKCTMAMAFSLLAVSNTIASTSDISLEIVSGQDSYFLPPGANIDLELVIRNHGPDNAVSMIFQTGTYLIRPIGEILLNRGRTGVPCPLSFTDFTTPSGQSLELAGFSFPQLAVGSEYRCRINVTALGVGRQEYTLVMQALSSASTHIDPDFSNNRKSARFIFFQAIQLNGPRGTALLLLFLLMMIKARKYI